MTIVICDDDPLFCQYLQSIIRDRFRNNVNVLTFSNGKDFLAAYLKQPSIDLIFLDLEMPGISGQEIAQVLRNTDKRMIIIIVTSHVDFARYAYEYDVHRYILKSEIASKVGEALDSAEKKIESKKRTFKIETDDGQHRLIDGHQILYAEYISRHVVMHTTDNMFRLKTSVPFYQIENDLIGELFVRCYKGIIVNIEAIASISKKQIRLINGVDIPISRQYEADVFKSFRKYVEVNHR